MIPAVRSVITTGLRVQPAGGASVDAASGQATAGDTFVAADAAASPPATPPVPSGAPAADLAAAMRSHPRLIIIIRHAEKPGNDPGDDSSGDPGLSPRGQQRADALAEALPQRYPHIDFLFATAPSTSSNRPVLTITPLADHLHMSIDERFADKEHKQVAHTLLTDSQYAGKTVLICWHHGKIPQLAQELGVTPPQDPWPSNTFDRIWQIDYDDAGHATVQNLPQNVLPGDSTQ